MKKNKLYMTDDEVKEAAALFGFRKDKKRIVKEKEINASAKDIENRKGRIIR